MPSDKTLFEIKKSPGGLFWYVLFNGTVVDGFYRKWEALKEAHRLANSFR